jgi:uncharacterized membrane protein
METVVGLFESERSADFAIRELQRAGFSKEHFGVMGQNAILQKVDHKEDKEQGTVQSENKLGAAGGAVVGGLGGLLIGVGALLIPGVGPVLAAGTLGGIIGAATAATGMGAAVGGLLGALTSLGISEEDAHVYAEGVKRGGILVVVQAEEKKTPLATEIMQRAGAIEVDIRRKSWEEAGWSGFTEETVPQETYRGL